MDRIRWEIVPDPGDVSKRIEAVPAQQSREVLADFSPVVGKRHRVEAMACCFESLAR